MIIKETKKRLASLLAATVTSLLISSMVFSVHAQTITENQPGNVIEFSQAQLEQMLAPIALYPDTLLTHILIAATYPIEVIDADRFLKLNTNLSEQAIIAKAENKEWDPSVKALLVFPRILDNLSQDLAWMRKLGDAFLQDESQVLASIQSLRKRADEAGNLAQMDNVEIVREKKTIIIEPAEPEVIYVPYYDTRIVYGTWHWSHYPPVYWHRPVHFSYYHGPFYWRTGVHIAFDFFFGAVHWRNHHVVRHHHTKRYYHSNRRIATSHHAKRWQHDPKHRRGVAYHSDKVKHRYVSNRPSVIHTSAERQRVKKQRHLSTGSKIDKRYVSPKHHQLKQRLTLNKAVKVNTDKQAKHQFTKKTTRGDKFFASSATKNDRVKLQPRSDANRSPLRVNDKGNNGWKSQSRVKISGDHHKPNLELPKKQRDPSRYQKQYSSNEHKKSYRAKGGHSTKQYSRVAKSSSNRHKSSSSSRQKHQ